MKKILSYAAPLAMALSGSFALPTVAQAESARPLVEACKAFIAAYPGYFDNLGACVSLPSQLCEAVKDGPGFPYTFGSVTLRNKGDCVNWVKANIV